MYKEAINQYAEYFVKTLHKMTKRVLWSLYGQEYSIYTEKWDNIKLYVHVYFSRSFSKSRLISPWNDQGTIEDVLRTRIGEVVAPIFKPK